VGDGAQQAVFGPRLRPNCGKREGSLWKDADPDIPILKEAKAEYAKLK
jgi:hypothetical protein